MGVLKVRVYPDPVLKQISRPVTSVDDKFRRFVGDLIETMQAYPGGIGISAPQVGVLSRVIVVDLSKKSPENKQLIMINPVVLNSSDCQIGREGCMSIPDFTANVRRARRIMVSWRDLDWNENKVESEGLEAVCIQHEIDHLDGLLFLDRVTSLKSDVFRRKNR